VTGSLGEATLQEQIYEPVLSVLAENGHRPKVLRDIVAHPQLRSLQFAQALQAILVLAGTGHVSLAQPVSKQTRSQCSALNRYLCERARGSSEVSFLASPVTGGGVLVPRFQQLFLLTQAPGKRSAHDLAKYGWDTIRRQGQRMVKDGTPVQTDDENVTELIKLAEAFLNRLPIFESLGIVESIANNHR
jgi:hypothetical protein